MNAARRFDALVIGGGPGGLAAALYLARFRRSVLVVDAQGSRAATIPRSHNVAGFPEGVVGAELVAAMRRHAERYGVECVRSRVEAIEQTRQGFSARWHGGKADATLVLLATGVSDVAPTMPLLAEALHVGALRYCPVCDGYEVIGKSVGLITDVADDVEEALFLRHFSERITLFVVAPGVRHNDAQRRQLADAGIAVVREPISGIRLVDGGVIVSHGGAQTQCESMYGALGLRVHHELATALGARLGKKGCLWTDAQQQTSIERLYAVGDVTEGLNQISVACGGGAIAATAMHRALRI